MGFILHRTIEIGQHFKKKTPSPFSQEKDQNTRKIMK